MDPRDILNKLNAEIMEHAGEWVPPTNLSDIRRALLKLTQDGKRVRILAVAQEADCSRALVEFCNDSGLLKGYTYKGGSRGGFTRSLHLIVDNT